MRYLAGADGPHWFIRNHDVCPVHDIVCYALQLSFEHVIHLQHAQAASIEGALTGTVGIP